MRLKDKLRLWHRAWRYVVKTERHEIALVRDLIQPGQYVLDIGAHKGAFSYWMAKATGPSGKVLACEPNPDLAAYLREVSSLFRPGQIEVLEAGFSDETTRKQLHFPSEQLGMASLEATRSSSRPSVEVETIRLDDYLHRVAWPQPVSLVKCDVEHHELAVMRGGEQMLREHRPILLFESANLHTGWETCQQVFRLLHTLGYEGCFFNGDRLTPIDQYDAQQHEARPDNQNYVFTHPAATGWLSKQRPYKVERLDLPRKQAA